MTAVPTLTPFLAAAENATLEKREPLAQATGPEMAVSGLSIWQEGNASVGIWQCEPGPSYWVHEKTEVIHIIRGRMTCTVDGGEPVALGPGDVAVFPKGWSGKWEIHETIRKVFVKL